MKIKSSHLSMVVMAALCFAASAVAQNDVLRAAAGDKYVISARAGGVNFVEGAVGIIRKDGRGGHLLKGDKLEIGDRISTGEDGRVEILLNPGSYLRLGGNAAFEFKTTALDDLKLAIDHGSAILEVFAADDFKVTVLTPHNKYFLVQTGVYRVDVPEQGAARLEVWKGKAQAGSEIVKGGKAVTGSGAGIAVAKFDRDEKDPLEIWSKGRSKELAKITASLSRNSTRTALMQSFIGRGWNMYQSFGLWIYDPFANTYCFLPFGYGWSSPYGYGYGRYLGWYQLPPQVYMPPANTGGGGGSPVHQSTTLATQGDRSPVPPFVRMQGTTGTGRGFSNTASNPDAQPSYSPNISSPSSSGSGGASFPVREPKSPEPQSKKP